jgi:hypothetical protein
MGARGLLALLLVACCGARAQSLALPASTLAVKVEAGFAAAQIGERDFHLIDLSKIAEPPRELHIAAEPFHVVSVRVQDFSISSDGALYVAAYVNFGLGDSRYALLRYDLMDPAAPPRLIRLPDLRCPHLAAGLRGAWCLDPEPRDIRRQPPSLHWIAYLGGVQSLALPPSAGLALGPPRVVVRAAIGERAAVTDDEAVAWLPAWRVAAMAAPGRDSLAMFPIPASGGPALTSFALAPGGSLYALVPLHTDELETLTTPYALVELDSRRDAWRRILPGRSFARGAQLAGWSAGGLWLWDRAARRLERIEGIQP